MTERTRPPLFVFALGALCAGAIVAAILVVGPASGSTSAQSRTVTVARGVVQSTDAGTGTVEPAKQLGVDFANSGSLKTVYVHDVSGHKRVAVIGRVQELFGGQSAVGQNIKVNGSNYDVVGVLQSHKQCQIPPGVRQMREPAAGCLRRPPARWRTSAGGRRRGCSRGCWRLSARSIRAFAGDDPQPAVASQ